MSRSTIEIFKDPKSPLVALVFAAMKEFGVDCVDWSPQSLREEIKDELDLTLTDLQSDRLQAGITMLSNEIFETDIKTFEACCRLATGQPDDFEDINPLEPEELVIGILDAYLVRGESITYGDEVNVYAGKIFHDYGFCNPPELFPSAIMPAGNKSDDKDKNEALQELFNQKIDEISEYMDSISSNE